MICPFIAVCRLKVSIEHYSNICSNLSKDAYKGCDEYKRLSAEPRTPSEWGRLLTITPPPP